MVGLGGSFQRDELTVDERGVSTAAVVPPAAKWSKVVARAIGVAITCLSGVTLLILAGIVCLFADSTAIVKTSDGRAYEQACPPLSSYVAGELPAGCGSSAQTTVVFALAVAAMGVSLVVTSVFLWRRLRAFIANPPGPSIYRNSGMPFLFWLSAALVGAFAALLVVGLVVALIRRGPPAIAGVAGVIFWVAIARTIYSYGTSKAYFMELEGDDIVWRAPLRRGSIRTRDLVRVDLRKAGTAILGEREAEFVSRSGEAFLIVIPDRHHLTRLRSFCELIQRNHEEVDIVAFATTPGLRD